MSKVGEVVLSRSQISNLESRCVEVGPLAEENYKRHQEWYASFCAREQQAWENRQRPQSKVRAKFDGAVRSRRHRPGTIGDLLSSKR